MSVLVQALVLALIALPCMSSAEVLSLGSVVRIKGSWNGERLEARRVRMWSGARTLQRGRVEGVVRGLSAEAGTFRVGPILVEWNPLTRFDGIAPEDVRDGAAVEVKGSLVAPGRLRATRIEPGSQLRRRVELRGVITEIHGRAGGRFDLVLLGVPVRVASLVFDEESLIRDPDDRRPEDQLTVEVFGRPLTIGGEIGTRFSRSGDFDLEHGEDEDSDSLKVGTQIELLYRPWPGALLFAEAEIEHERELHRQGGEREADWEASRGETWLLLRAPFEQDISLQIGRQAFREDRKWWWSEDLDAIRLRWQHLPFALSVAVARELGRVSSDEHFLDPEQDGVVRLLSQASWRLSSEHRLDLFLLRQVDHSSHPDVGEVVSARREDESDEDLLWLGLRGSGELDLGWLGEADYWLDAARVSGRETLFDLDDEPGGRFRVESRTRSTVRGWGFDTGISWALPMPFEPTLTFSWAFGSGDDDPSDDSDHAFRQTGLQSNNGKFRGVDRFRYYGELLRPELSNLEIATFGFGFRFLSSSSVELLYHYYRQDQAAPFLRRAKIDADPSGRGRSLGQEWDLVIGLEEWEHFEVEIVAALFRAGPAFGPRSGAYAKALFLKLDYNF